MNSSDIYKYLILNHGMSDPYMSLIDFQDYVNKSREIFTVYKDRERFNKMSLVNIAKAGVFAADRAVKEYADKIWGIESIK